MGGMWAIAWTDLIQGVIRIIVGFIFFYTIFHYMHGVSGIMPRQLPSSRSCGA